MRSQGADPAPAAPGRGATGDPLDLVLQRLYALGLTIQSVAASLPDDERGERLVSAVESIDVTIREVRTHMELTTSGPAGGVGPGGGRRP